MTTLTIDGVRKAVFNSYNAQRPLAIMSFALNYYFDGYNVAGYHIVNILIHIIGGIFLYIFVKTTLRLPSLHFKDTTPEWIASFTVLIWLVHPLHTQSVTYIVQRMNSLAAMFYILSMLLYAKARLSSDPRQRWILFAGCTLAAILALGSKEMALTLPLFLLLYEWYFFQDLSLLWFKRYLLSFLGILLLLALVSWAYLGTDIVHKVLFFAGDFDFTLQERVLTEFRVLVVYIKLLIFPHPSQLNIDYDFPLSHSLFDPITTLFALGTIVGLLGLALYLARQERLLSFCVLWFFGNLVIESSVIMLDIVFEHRTYLPSMLFILLAVTFVVRSITLPWLRVVGLCAVALVFSVWTYERNSVWANEVTLWRDCVEKSPHKARPHTNLAYALMRQGNLEEAVRHYTEALRITPSYAPAHNNLGDILVRQGNLEEAVRHYTEALRVHPDYAAAQTNLGNALMDLGHIDEAVSHLTTALQLTPDSAEAYNNLGSALAAQGKVEEAMHHYAEALRLNPSFAAVYNNLGNLLARQGRIEEAVRHYTEALRLRPNYALAHNNLGSALERQGRVEEAVRHYTEALRLNPNLTQARKNLDRVRRRIGASAEPSHSDLKP